LKREDERPQVAEMVETLPLKDSMMNFIKKNNNLAKNHEIWRKYE
jgi:hypothetical protein